MPNFRIKGVKNTDDTPVFSLEDDNGDLTLYVEFDDGEKEAVFYIDNDGINRRYLSTRTVQRLQSAGIRMDDDRINDY